MLKIRLFRVIGSLVLFALITLLAFLTSWHKGMILGLYLLNFLIIGYDIILKAINNVFRGKILDENFLMFIASIGAFIIGEYTEAVAVIIFYQVGELFQDVAVFKSRKNIASLIDIKPEFANILVDEEIKQIIPEEIQIGDIIIVRNGEKIPVDGKVIKGESILDTACLTGESLPQIVKVGDEILSGCINIGSVLHVKAEKIYYESTVSKILDLIENVSGKKAKSEKFITKFATVYTPVVVGLFAVIFLLPSLITGAWQTWLYRALNFLVVSCPCALVISVPLAFFCGIGGASKKGILIKGGEYLERLNKTDTFIFDKTGTLTTGEFEIKSVFPENNRDEIISLACICENNSNHPIARSIMRENKGKIEPFYSVTEIAGKGLIAKKENSIIYVGNYDLLKENQIDCTEINDGYTTVYVAKDGQLIGYITVGDTIKQEAIETINELNKTSNTIMLTGDNEYSAKTVSKIVGVKEYHYKLLPNDKLKILEEKISQNKKVVFIGDGINDAPSLIRADVGVSMGQVGSEVAIESSDIVLMYDDLKALLTAKKIARRTVKTVKINIIFALIIKFGVMILSVFGLVSLYLGIFADVGVAVLAIINSMRLVKNK